MFLLDIYIEHDVASLDDLFTYYSLEEVDAGVRVLVDFNKQKNIVGFVYNVKKIDEDISSLSLKYGYRILKINEIIDQTPIINEDLFEFSKQIKEKSFASYIKILKTILPDKLKPLSSSISKKDIIYEDYLSLNKDLKILELNKKETEFIKKIEINDLKVTKELLNKKYIQSLLSKKYILIKKKIKNRYEIKHIFNEYEEKIHLTTAQQKAFLEIKESLKPVLFNGVTGSGKTEIYIKLIEDCLNNNKSALVLVPEIALTTLMIDRIYTYFKKDIFVLNSSLTNYQKYVTYLEIQNKDIAIVIGTRSALFAPINNLGLICIDECHDSSYIQESDFSYNAIELAFLRNNAKVVLGSATPSIEQQALVLKNKVKLVELNEKFNSSKIEKIIINRADYKNFLLNSTIFSNFAVNEIKKTLEKKLKILLIVNNKGYSRTLQCRECGHTFRCPTCNLPLAYSYNQNKLVCYRCSYFIDKPKSCPRCSSNYLIFNGFGIEKVEEDFKKIFPDIKYQALDGDKILKDNNIYEILNKFNKGETEVLIGTQIISKGHDFKNVGLLVILNADTFLNLPSYKSNELTFNLIYQSLGRIGRDGINAKAIIQTGKIDNKIINFALKENGYKEFLEYELKNRHLLNNPPFINYLKITLKSHELNILKDEISNLKLELINKKYSVIGPSVPIINNYLSSISLIIKYKKNIEINDLINNLILRYKQNKNLKIYFSNNYS